MASSKLLTSEIYLRAIDNLKNFNEENLNLQNHTDY